MKKRGIAGQYRKIRVIGRKERNIICGRKSWKRKCIGGWNIMLWR